MSVCSYTTVDRLRRVRVSRGAYGVRDETGKYTLESLKSIGGIVRFCPRL